MEKVVRYLCREVGGKEERQLLPSDVVMISVDALPSLMHDRGLVDDVLLDRILYAIHQRKSEG